VKYFGGVESIKMTSYMFSGARHITRNGVQYILSTVIQELTNHPDRKFSQCETGFFWRWYTHQTDDVKQQVQTLVNNGKFVWCALAAR
jgi:hypothetical protein